MARETLTKEFENESGSKSPWDIVIAFRPADANPNQEMNLLESYGQINNLTRMYPFASKAVSINIEREGAFFVSHHYFNLDEYIEGMRIAGRSAGAPDLSREGHIVELLQDEDFMAACILSNVDRVGDAAGNVLDLNKVVVPFVPAGSEPELAGPKQSSLDLLASLTLQP